MAFQMIPGVGMMMPRWPPITVAGGAFTSSTIDATGEKFAWIGRVWNKDRATKSVRKVGFLFGSVTKAGGSGLTISLQDVDVANGPAHRPDETQDQTVAIANGNAAFATDTWCQTDAFSADRSVTHGELLAVVGEFDGSGRQGADSVAFKNLTYNVFGGAPYHLPACTHKTASWAFTNGTPNIILEFSDGTFGTLLGAWPVSATGVISYKQDSSPDENALEFEVPFKCKVDGFWVNLRVNAATSNFEVVLYDGTTAMTGGTVTCDGNISTVAAAEGYLVGSFSQEIELAANTTYRLGIKPTQTTSTISLVYFDIAAAGHFQAHDLGSDCVLTTRSDLGAWAAPTATRRPLAGLFVSSFDDGAGGGGGSGEPGNLSGGIHQ
jgi:hypothetical protein